jgi:hypothetical protein
MVVLRSGVDELVAAFAEGGERPDFRAIDS